ncbi:MAG: DUF6756 family protein [Leptolyngbyaceae cyanobacterium bins.302]|nr:DUF6756 family protein [Leptolyngbyaceae cyanobacterium bins.302]
MTESLTLRDEITLSLQELHIPAENFHFVSLHSYQSILEQIVEYFTVSGKKTLTYNWWWDSFNFKEPCITYNPESGYPEELLPHLIPAEELVWFVATDSGRQRNKFWLCEGTIKAIAQVIANSYSFEYYLASKKFRWLLCVNHHDILIAVGEEMVNKLQKFPNVKGAIFTDVE